jgi:cleavage and polyadenylation specificity factor subunit 1
MHALRREVLPPSGVEFAVSLSLRPASPTNVSGKQVIRNLVVARSNYLRVFEVCEEPAPLPPVEDAVTSGRKGTEAVEGEVEMDEQGEGFVNVGFVKVIILLIEIYVYLSCNGNEFFDYICHGEC